MAPSLRRRAGTVHALLDAFPVEVLSHILRLVAPVGTLEDDKERRAALRICCLVNRRMRALAQPMLFQLYKVKSADGLARLAVEVDGKPCGSLVKLLVFSGHWPGAGISMSLASPGPAIDLCPNVVDLRLDGCEAVDLERLGSMNRDDINGSLPLQPASSPLILLDADYLDWGPRRLTILAQMQACRPDLAIMYQRSTGVSPVPPKRTAEDVIRFHQHLLPRLAAVKLLALPLELETSGVADRALRKTICGNG
ncbi:hypothetical protein JCM8097_005320 [Rhodosporidiobolus ruineniae]